MSDEMLRPGDYRPAPEDIEQMFGGFAADRARMRARRAAYDVVRPAVKTGIDMGGPKHRNGDGQSRRETTR
ncbi:hypothetical protein [Longimicrobium sp.]|jgi:hypothetical protein|uniref:hypothetical protein n=1 Tax=Longimicrobium sp. TaxID=2029185 RepID=UPI002F9275B2